MRLFWLACLQPLICIAFCAKESLNGQSTEESKAAFERTSQLYITLRNIAYPEKPLRPDAKIESRFVLNMPGKVLNYFDYYPGLEYTKFLQDYNTKRKESVVPPHVMEKWFDLADAMPSPNPLNGQETGKSLAYTYASILHEIRFKGLDHTADKLTSIYQHAINFLVEQLIDPEAPEKNSTRLGLYERYRDQYNDRKLEMEDQIENKRMSFGGLDYELWFQRHYPSLNAKVESAYTKWMVFGQKEMVELYLADMDTGSSGQLIEQARMALRAAGVQSLDRTRTIYPVSFEPSDWYKYLLPKLQRPSRDQLLQMIGTVSSKIQAIDAMKSVVQNLDDTSAIAITSNALKDKYNRSQTNLNKNITQYMASQYQCMAADTDKKKVCLEYHNNETEAIIAMEVDSQIFMDYQANVYTSRSEYITKLTEQRNILEAQRTRLYALLGETSPYLGGLLDAEPLAVANISDAYKDDQWMQFEFDSEQYHENKESEATQESTVANMGFHVLFFSGGGTYSHSKDTDYHNDQLAQSQMKAKGELLRVTIKRPWFKPEIFDDPNLTYKESDGYTDAFVSPGRLPEGTFYERLSQDSSVRYKLPEYTTAFLLARDIELEFSGLDSKTVSYVMQEQSHYEGHGGFLFFHAGVSVSKGKQTSHVSVDRTADGMRIKIPGAQVIGYYTEVVPLFPADTTANY